jgi:hypothetical protein
LEFSTAEPDFARMVERSRVDYLGVSPARSVIRMAPMLTVAGDPGRRNIVVGRTRVVVSGRGAASLEVTVVGAWRETGIPGSFASIDNPADDADVAVGAIQDLPQALKAVPKGGNETRAAQLARTLCERSRSSLAELREIRYALEDSLARTSMGASATAAHTSVVAGLLQLNIICARAADQARELAREGLWVYLSDDEAYHSYRRLQDPSLLIDHRPATHRMRPWMQLHDSAMRHCIEMRKQLDAECESIRSLITSASSISSAKDADSQSRFNVLAAIASVGIGLPALVLSLYGADILVPMNTAARQLAFAPVAASLIIAAVIATWQGARLKRGWIWTAGAVGIIGVLLLLLLTAGVLAPSST